MSACTQSAMNAPLAASASSYMDGCVEVVVVDVVVVVAVDVVVVDVDGW